MVTLNPWRVLAIALGALWIFDGLLQFQPRMFGEDFVNSILVPNLSSQPAFLHTVVQLGINLWQVNPPVFDALAGLFQVAIGILLLFPLKSLWFKVGAYTSIVWGIIVWLCGEGMGLLLTGNASFYTGAPGAVTLYVILAIFLLNTEKLQLVLLPKIAGAVFILGAALQLQSNFWSAFGVEGVAMAGMMEPVEILKAFPLHIMNTIGIEPVFANSILAILLLILGVLLLVKANRITGGIALLFLLFVWWIGQDFGMLTSGIGTDPSTAPLLALFVLPLFLMAPSIKSLQHV